jgi:hypothetical protein
MAERRMVLSEQDLSDQERQFIECLREQKATDGFSLTINLEGGAWEVEMRTGKLRGRGVGATFDAAWDNVTGLQFG